MPRCLNFSAGALTQPLVGYPQAIALWFHGWLIDSYSNNEKTLLAATKSSFVIQLFGSYSSKNAQDFMTDNATKAVQLRRYRTEHKGKAWHVVIAGPFESRVAATQQSKRLTEKLRQQKPWIRSISPIQLGLKARS